MTKETRRAARKPDDGFPKHVTVTVRPPTTEGRDRYCKVEPSEVCVRYGGTVTFRSTKGCGPLEVFVPTPKRAPKAFPRVATPLVTVPATKEGRKVEVTRGAGIREYPYAIYCRGCNCFGRGSMPKMIIGPENP
jgi:hypothetical protein